MSNSQSNASEQSDLSSESLTPDQFAALYQSLYPRLWLTATGMIGDRIHADDIVQEAVVIALKKLDQFTVGTNMSAWLGEIVRRCALNYVRKTRNRATVATDPTNLDRSSSAAIVGQPVGLSEMMSEHQLSFDDDVMRALAAIGDMARCCILLRTVQQLTYSEIATLLGIPEGTAMSHVHRAKTRMREVLMSKDWQGTSANRSAPDGPV